MEPDTVKKALNDTIQAVTDTKWLFSVRPDKDNTRNRKFPFQKMLSAILAFRGGTLNREIMDFFGLDPSVGASSAFIQSRAKILPEAFEFLFRDFTDKIDENKLYHRLRLLAIDGSDLQIAANPCNPDSFFPGVDGQKAYNLLPLNAMYDVLQHTYVDAIVQKRRCSDESGALTDITNLDAESFPLEEIKRLYAMRWGIETSFRNLKYTLGLLYLHAKKVEFVLQEIFAKLTMYNFCEMITQSVVIHQGQRKHSYKVNFSDAVHVCFKFFLGIVSPPNVEALLMKYISPIRPGRKNTCKPTQKAAFRFTYRVA